MNIFEHFRALVAIPSPSWKEDGVAGYITMTMEELGYSFKDDEDGNLLFWKTGCEPETMLVAHMDTVDKALDVHMLENSEAFYTDGNTALGADDKAALAVLLTLAEKEENALFLFTRAEELGLQGSAKIKKDFFYPFNVKTAFVLDAAGPVGTIISSAPGKDKIEITMHGKSAHAGFSPESGINAIKAAAHAVEITPVGRIDDETTCNIGSFIAAGPTNIVPDKATLAYEVRSLSDKKRNEISSSIAKNAEDAASLFGAECEANIIHQYSQYTLSEDDTALIKAKKAAESMGKKCVLRPTVGGSDTNNLRQIGIDAITLSIGYENAHSVNERMPKEEMENLLKLTSLLLS